MALPLAVEPPVADRLFEDDSPRSGVVERHLDHSARAEAVLKPVLARAGEDDDAAARQRLTSDATSDPPRFHTFLAHNNGQPVGYAIYFYTYSTFQGRHGIWLEDLFVDPVMRGKGAGKALLQHLAQRCVAEGLGRFEWWVLDWNTPSIDFYKSLGAVPLSDWEIFRLTGDALEQLATRRPT